MRRSLARGAAARALFFTLTTTGWMHAAAADKSWSAGAGDGKLGSAGNWTPAGVPAAGDVITFPNTLSGSIAEDVDMLSLTGIAFGAGTQSGVYHLAPVAGRAPVTLGTGGVAASYGAGALLANDSVDCALKLGATQAWALTSPVDVGGDIDLAGFNLTLNAGSGTGTMSGAISGAGALLKLGAGTVKLAGAGANTFGGATTVSGGILQLAKSSGVAIPGTLTLNSGAVVSYLADDQIADNALITFGGSTLKLNGHSDVIGGLGTGGTLDLGAGGKLTINQAESGLQLMTIVGDAASSIHYEDSLTFDLSLSGAGWSGTLVVDNGVVRSAQTVAFKVLVNSGGTAVLGGTIGALTVGNKGSLLPGSQPTPGPLACGDLLLAAGSNVELRILGVGTFPASDQLRVTGAVTLGGTLDLALGYTPAIGDSIVLIDNDGSDAVSGTFAGLPEGAYLANGQSHWRISYSGGDGNDVTVTATLPPPDLAHTIVDMSTINPSAADLAVNVVSDAGVAADDLATATVDLGAAGNGDLAVPGAGAPMKPPANHGGCEFAVGADPVAGAGWLLLLGGALLGWRAATRIQRLRARRR